MIPKPETYHLGAGDGILKSVIGNLDVEHLVFEKTKTILSLGR